MRDTSFLLIYGHLWWCKKSESVVTHGKCKEDMHSECLITSYQSD